MKSSDITEMKGVIHPWGHSADILTNLRYENRMLSKGDEMNPILLSHNHCIREQKTRENH